MRLFSRAFGPILASAIGVFGVISVASADMDPDEVQQANAVAEAQAQEAAAQPLGQFPRTEMAPMASVQSATAPRSISTRAAVTTASNEKEQSIDFPKVQTPQDEELAKKFQWWPTDAKPAPFKDPNRSGYWWWPKDPGEADRLSALWGNQGFIYVKKIIFDYKSSEGEMKPSLVIKRIIKNVKVLFDYDKSDLRDDAMDVLDKAMYTLEHNEKADILITGNADMRGSEQYNQKLGEKRAASVERYMIQKGLSEDRIRILSRGKLDAMAPVHDLVGMQKDRNAQFMIAEVEEVMIPADKAELFKDKAIEEKEELEGEVRVSTKDYVIKSGDTLWGIAEREYGDGKQWKRIYEFNKDVISNPNRPRKGAKIQIPIE